MHQKKFFITIIILIGGIIVFSVFRKPAVAPVTQKIETSAPVADTSVILDRSIDDVVIISPFVFSGKARGVWFFEASFPVRVLDGAGRELGIGIAQADGEWMTNDFVPFHGTVSFPSPVTATGTVIFQKDNPSDLREHDGAVTFPIKFR